MIGHRTVSLLVVGVITATVLVSGPFVPVDFTTYDHSCKSGVPSNGGSATIKASSVPQSATLEQSEFGAKVWKLTVPDAEVSVTDIQGCVRLTYEISIDTLGTTSFSSATISSASPERQSIFIPQTTFSPDRIKKDRYDAELRLTSLEMENGAAAERTIASRNITVEVTA